MHGYAPSSDIEVLENAIWADMGGEDTVPTGLGMIGGDKRNEPLAVTQLLLLYHLFEAAR